MSLIKAVEDMIETIHTIQGVDKEKTVATENNEDGIPTSWVDDNGIRHAVIQEPTLPEYMRLVKVNGEWELKSDVPF
jgi:hypothetical protein